MVSTGSNIQEGDFLFRIVFMLFSLVLAYYRFFVFGKN